MRAKLLAGLLTGVVVTVAILIWIRSRQPQPLGQTTPAASTASAPAPPETRGNPGDFERQLYRDIARGGVTTERALQLFSIVVGPLPGVNVPENAAEPGEFCATAAVNAVFAVWPSLTDAQRAAIRQYIGSPSRVSDRMERPRLMLSGFLQKPVATPRFNYQQYASDANNLISPLVGQPPIRFGLDVYDYDLDPNTKQINHSEKAATYSWDGSDKPQPDGCHIRVFDSVFGENKFSAVDAQTIMAHEMFHCYQQRAIGNQPQYRVLRRWMIEGEADFVMATLGPGSDVYVKDWNVYATSPTTKFVDRGQDGIGVFGHLADVTGGLAVVWGRMLSILVTATNSGDYAAFQALIDGYVIPYYTQWGPSYFRDSTQAPVWTMSVPGQLPTLKASPTDLTVNADDLKVFPLLGPYEAEIVKVSSNADVLAVATFGGYGHLHDEGYGLDVMMMGLSAVGLCLNSGGCRCPDGSPGASIATKPAKGPIYVGLAGGDDFGRGGAAGKKLEDFCKNPSDPPAVIGSPNGGGDGGGPAGDPPPETKHPDTGYSHDDTHIETFDGIRYDFQVVGEYTLVRSTKDDFAVQVRQVPAMKSRMVTLNQAMATKIGDRRVTLSMENASPVLRIDGAAVTDPVVSLPGGSIAKSSTLRGTYYVLNWPDGTSVEVEQLGARALNVRVKPAATRKGALTGLMGNDNGVADDDLVGAAGAMLGAHPSPDVINHALAGAWRVAEGASLFDYQPGQSAATFVDPTFPESNVDPTRVPNREAAEKICRTAGVTDPQLLNECVIDYGMTSDFLFASSYSHEQQVVALKTRVAAASTGVVRTVMMEGKIADANGQASVPFTANAGDIVWIGNPDCVDNGIQGGIAVPNGKRLGGGAICAFGRLTLPATGDYTLVTRKQDNPVGAYRIPIRFVRPDRVQATHYGAVIAGNIETRGAHDVYTFDGHEGDVLRIAGEGCELGMLVISIVRENGSDFLGPNCRAGNDTRLTASGTFKMVINGGDGGFGPYHFVLQGVAGSGR